MGVCLDGDWKSKHAPILHDDCPPLPRLPPRPKKPLCSEVGVCLCCDSGRMTYEMRNKFLRVMKCVCKKGSMGYRLLLDRCLVLQLHGHRSAAAEDPWAIAAGEQEIGSVDTKLYLHIGAHSFSPYFSTFLRLKEAVGGMTVAGGINLVVIRRALWGIGTRVMRNRHQRLALATPRCLGMCATHNTGAYLPKGWSALGMALASLWRHGQADSLYLIGPRLKARGGGGGF